MQPMNERVLKSPMAVSVRNSMKLHRREPPMIKPALNKSLGSITFRYLGPLIKLDYEKEDPRDDITIMQQHNGGENLCVYHGKHQPGEEFTVTSQRHSGFPFSITLYVNNMKADRVSACCGYKHKPKGTLGRFKFVRVTGAHPCYKCMMVQRRKQLKKSKKEAQKARTPVPPRKLSPIKFENSSEGGESSSEGESVSSFSAVSKGGENKASRPTSKASSKRRSRRASRKASAASSRKSAGSAKEEKEVAE